MFNDVIIGERLRLNAHGMVCASEVRDILPDGRVVISIPSVDGHAVPLTPGETVEMSYHSGGGLSSFTARVEERIPYDDMECYTITYASLITKSQRRGFVRAEMAVPVSIRVIGADTGARESVTIESLIENLAQIGASPAGTVPPYQTTTLDLSAGGIAFSSRIPFAPNILVQCEMAIGGLPFRADGLVTYVDEDAKREPRYKVSVQFAEMDARQQRRIIRYLIDEEQRVRRNAE
jgi:c-di-GMP-binding flagellar brake protein YcgR